MEEKRRARVRRPVRGTVENENSFGVIAKELTDPIVLSVINTQAGWKQLNEYIFTNQELSENFIKDALRCYGVYLDGNKYIRQDATTSGACYNAMILMFNSYTPSDNELLRIISNFKHNDIDYMVELFNTLIVRRVKFSRNVFSELTNFYKENPVINIHYILDLIVEKNALNFVPGIKDIDELLHVLAKRFHSDQVDNPGSYDRTFKLDSTGDNKGEDGTVNDVDGIVKEIEKDVNGIKLTRNILKITVKLINNYKLPTNSINMSNIVDIGNLEIFKIYPQKAYSAILHF